MPTFNSGLEKPNDGVLKALKNSARNSRVLVSVSGVFLMIEMSKLRWSGPLMIPFPLSPNPVAKPSLPTTGGRVNWAGLAADLGYSDQSHLVTEFRSLTGLTPGRWIASRRAGSKSPSRQLFGSLL